MIMISWYFYRDDDSDECSTADPVCGWLWGEDGAPWQSHWHPQPNWERSRQIWEQSFENLRHRHPEFRWCTFIMHFSKYSIMTSSLIKVMQKSTKCNFLLKIIQLLCLGFDFDLCLKLEKTEVWSWRCRDVENTKIPRWWFSWALAARLRPLLGSRKPWSWSRGWRCMFTILTIPPRPLSTKPIIEPTLTLDDP